MTSRLRSYEFQRFYEASASDLASAFYVPAMMRSTSYDRAAGYFRSSVFHLVSLAVSDFILRGGKMRLVCSTSLQPQDEAAIRSAQVTPDDVDRSITQDIREALADPASIPVVELLATMLKIGALDLKVAYKADERGIFHPKVGVFSDDSGDSISFDGSINETFMAWAHNEERFKTFRSWVSSEEELTRTDKQYFDDLWEGRRPSLYVKRLPDVASEILDRHAHPDPQAAVEKVRQSISKMQRVSRRPPKTLQPHQSEVLESWDVDKRGIVDHVTGGGKTITALACVRRWLEASRRHVAIILVPSDILSVQWRNEVDSELGTLDPHVLHVGGSRSASSWHETVGEFTQEFDSARPRIVIATMDSAATERFLNRADVGEHTLLVADEVHTIGAAGRRKILGLDAGARLGLSATPERFGDPDGTAVIFDYFGEILEPRFTIRDAQSSTPPRLVSYDYFVHSVMLDEEEAEEYRRLSKQIGAAAGQASDGNDREAGERLRLKLIERARVLKTARAKVPLAVRLLSEQYAEGQRWLVYCDDTDQLEEIRDSLPSVGLSAMHYISSMVASKPATLERFEKVGGILLSIRCLDEGVDIPNISHALILASSLNPREHLQRRGRVLRTAAGKPRAYIHDALVGLWRGEDELVFSTELKRARSFAGDATNRRHIRWALDQMLAHDVDVEVDVENDGIGPTDGEQDE